MVEERGEMALRMGNIKAEMLFFLSLKKTTQAPANKHTLHLTDASKPLIALRNPAASRISTLPIAELSV